MLKKASKRARETEEKRQVEDISSDEADLSVYSPSTEDLQSSSSDPECRLPSPPKRKKGRFSEDPEDKENLPPKERPTASKLTSGATTSPLTITSSQLQVYTRADQVPALEPLALNPVATASGGEIPSDVLALVRNQQALDAQRSLTSAQMIMAAMNHYSKK